jgi:hypothetical protein
LVLSLSATAFADLSTTSGCILGGISTTTTSSPQKEVVYVYSDRVKKEEAEDLVAEIKIYEETGKAGELLSKKLKDVTEEDRADAVEQINAAAHACLND